MLISKEYISPIAKELLTKSKAANEAYVEITDSIKSITNKGSVFIINKSQKNCNGVVPIKEKCYLKLENYFGWYREKPLSYLQEEMKKGGPMDVYKEFSNLDQPTSFKVGLEFETGNISSAHRSLNKLLIGLLNKELDLAALMMPVKTLSYYLTDRVSNYEELAPYFILLDKFPFIVWGFDADEYSDTVEILPKGKDGMSKRTIRKWGRT